MARKSTAGTVRIIGGQWRGRKLPVPDLPGLRPSGDRGRETLFNWLAPSVPGARCVDLFAGTGALGLEAASRGAAHVDLVEVNPQAARNLQLSCELLGSDQLTVHKADALAWIAHNGPFDIVFADPPFDLEQDSNVLAACASVGFIRAGGFCYLESARAAPPPLIPKHWSVHREKRMGEVMMRLFRCSDR